MKRQKPQVGHPVVIKDQDSKRLSKVVAVCYQWIYIKNPTGPDHRFHFLDDQDHNKEGVWRNETAAFKLLEGK